jgi:hypothetical protein
MQAQGTLDAWLLVNHMQNSLDINYVDPANVMQLLHMVQSQLILDFEKFQSQKVQQCVFESVDNPLIKQSSSQHMSARLQDYVHSMQMTMQLCNDHKDLI